MTEFLKKIKIIQYCNINDKRRLNPFNPLSYVLIVLVLIIGIIMFGLVGIKDELDFRNPFIWK